MCGIIGVISESGIFSQEKTFARDGLKDILHRGPDHHEIQTYNNRVLLGHARLSIVDLSEDANQPMSSDCGRVVIVFNGEIYNYLDLRNGLKNKYLFRTDCDTEVILAAYLEYGIEETLERLEGFFAFAIYDMTKGKVYIARDKLGKKPVYVYRMGKQLFFSSELRAFARLDGFIPKLCYQTRQSVLQYKYSSNPSIFSNVDMIAPGTYLDIRLDPMTVRRAVYFKIADLVSPDTYARYSRMSTEELIQILDVLLNDAVKKRLFTSDVPVCSINSGGLDSSLITAVAARYQNVELFHVDVEGSSEFQYAQALERHLDLVMHSARLDRSNVVDLFETAAVAYEYYMTHLNNAGIYLLSSEIRKKSFKVVLGGETADELFGGYPRFIQYIKLLPAAKLLDAPFLKKLFGKIVAGYYQRIFHPLTALQYNRCTGSSGSLIQMATELKFNQMKQVYSFVESDNEASLQALLLMDINEYLQPLFLRGDKLFMANSVEQRLPFADINLVQFALNLPIRFKTGKMLLKKVAEKYIPRSIIYRDKIGFRTPFESLILERMKEDSSFHSISKMHPSAAISYYGIYLYLSCFFSGFEQREALTSFG